MFKENSLPGVRFDFWFLTLLRNVLSNGQSSQIFLSLTIRNLIIINLPYIIKK